MARPKYLAAWRERFQKQAEEEQQRAELARKELAKAVAILRRHGAKRVILFGSLSEKMRLRPRSDIDLAVEEIKKTDFVRAYADLMMALDFPIDLKPLEELSPTFKESVLQRGEVLYEE